jgi:hypothetical protein
MEGRRRAWSWQTKRADSRIHETGFDISRDQKMELKDRIGTVTNEALVMAAACWS